MYVICIKLHAYIALQGDYMRTAIARPVLQSMPPGPGSFIMTAVQDTRQFPYAYMCVYTYMNRILCPS